MEFVEI